jgi:hypothetical protein
MPSEERFITFSLDEVQKALSISLIQKDMELLPKGNLISLEISNDEDKKEDIFLKIENSPSDVSNLNFDRKFFAEALVFYCQGSGIPLPRSGQKLLNILKDKIIMKITMN